MEKLLLLQQELNVPKKQYNKHGNFKYRSCEDILTAVKPLLAKHQLFLKIMDELVFSGDRYYIRAVAEITDGENRVRAAGYAREPASRKGMSEDQITGSSSSYARKYALNALFLIDDTKDADTRGSQEKEKDTRKVLTPADKINWNKAIVTYKKYNNFDRIEEFFSIATKHKNMIISMAKEETT